MRNLLEFATAVGSASVEVRSYGRGAITGDAGGRISDARRQIGPTGTVRDDVADQHEGGAMMRMGERHDE